MAWHYLPSTGSYALEAKQTQAAPAIDGVMDSLWQAATWQPLNHHILGAMPSAEDFSGRFQSDVGQKQNLSFSGNSG